MPSITVAQLIVRLLEGGLDRRQSKPAPHPHRPGRLRLRLADQVLSIGRRLAGGADRLNTPVRPARP